MYVQTKDTNNNTKAMMHSMYNNQRNIINNFNIRLLK